MAVTDWSIDPSQNVTIDGINIAENCPAGNLNNAIRSVMGSVRVAFNGVPSTNNLVAKSGGVFTGNPIHGGRGGYLHFAAPALVDGRVHILPEGAARPDAGEGAGVFYYS